MPNTCPASDQCQKKIEHNAGNLNLVSLLSWLADQQNCATDIDIDFVDTEVRINPQRLTLQNVNDTDEHDDRCVCKGHFGA